MDRKGTRQRTFQETHPFRNIGEEVFQLQLHRVQLVFTDAFVLRSLENRRVTRAELRESEMTRMR